MNLRITKPIVDDGPLVVRQEQPATTKRRRGRPVRATTNILLGQHSHLTNSDFSFVRAVLQSVAPIHAARRYLIGFDTMNTVEATRYRDAVIERLLSDGIRLSSHGEEIQASVRLYQSVIRKWWLKAQDFKLTDKNTAVVAAVEQAPEASRFPSFDDYLESRDWDGFSMDEIVEEYTEQYGVSPAEVSQVIVPAEKVVSTKPPIPSFDEFMEGRDWDGFSIEEIVDEYKEAFGVLPTLQASTTPKPDTTTISGAVLAPSDPEADPHSIIEVSESPFAPSVLAHVAYAIGVLQGAFSVSPHGNDAVTTWIAEHIADKFLPCGVITLKDLTNWINLNGKNWFNKVRGIGIAKAQRIVQWLIDNEQTIGVQLSPLARSLAEKPTDLIFGVQRSELALSAQNSSGKLLAATWEAQEYGIVPIEYFDWPSVLRGHNGVFRSRDDNTLGVTDDSEAVREWLSSYLDSPNTHKLYSRAIECLVLWAVVEKNKSLSSLTTPDLLEFRGLLKAPPAHWVQTQRVQKSSKDWRPLRGPLKDKSIESVMRAVTAFYSAMHAANYLRANPSKGLSKLKRTDITFDTTRSFSNQDLEVISQCFKQMPEGVRKNRLRAIILLFQTTGLRKNEAIKLTWSNLTRARTGNNVSDTWAMTFIGKGDKERTIPIPAATFKALWQHREDRTQLTQTKKLAYMHHFAEHEWPLIGIIDETVAQARAGTAGEFIYNAPKEANTSGALSEMRLHEILKDFFAQCAKLANEKGADSHNFEHASAHWLRHTFAHLILQATDNDLTVTQQLLGHASISTTGIYTKADMTKRVNAINKLNIDL